MGSSREKARVMEVDNGFARKGLRGHGYSSIVKLKTGDEDAAMVKDWVSFLVIGFVVFIGDTARGLMFPTLWPLVSKLGGTELTQGFTVAAFSFGRVLSSPHFGKMSTDYGYKKVLTFAACVMIAGCFLYATAQNCYWLIAGQVVIGLGSGTLGVTRAYVADNSTKRSRTVLMAYLTALQYGGFTVTPCVGGLLSYLLGDQELSLLPGLSLTQYTAPALLTAALALAAVALLAAGPFRDYVPAERAALARPPSRPALPASSVADNLVNYKPTTPLPAAHPEEVSTRLWRSMVAWGLIMNVVTKGSVACYETLGTIVAIGSFGMSKPDAGFLFSSCGFLGVFALLSMKCLTAWADDIKLVFYGCLVMVASATLLFLDARIGLHGFFAAVFLMYSVGYPIGHTAVIGIFSKIVGARTQQQGSLLGWFGSAGSLARIIFPILCGVVSSEYGSNTVFSVTGVVLAGSVVVLLCLWTKINILIS